MSMTGYFVAVPQAELNALRQDPEDASTFLYETHADDALDVGKAWHGIHFLLTGTVGGGSGPLDTVVYGRTPLDEEMQYGTVMATDAADVPAIAAALAAVPDEALRQRFDPSGMDDIYPNCWDEPDALDWLMEHLQALKAFYRDAAAAGRAVVMSLD